MTQSFECPRCHLRAEGERGPGWSSRCCPDCGAPMVLAPAPAEEVVRKYLYGHRLPPVRNRRSESLHVKAHAAAPAEVGSPAAR